jgi:hypothetical protein
MAQVLQENFREMIVFAFMAIWWMCVGFLSIKGDVNSLDKKRIAKGMQAMTDDEKLLGKQTFRSSILNNFIQVIIAGVVAFIVVHLI